MGLFWPFVDCCNSNIEPAPTRQLVHEQTSGLAEARARDRALHAVRHHLNLCESQCRRSPDYEDFEPAFFANHPDLGSL